MVDEKVKELKESSAVEAKSLKRDIEGLKKRFEGTEAEQRVIERRVESTKSDLSEQIRQVEARIGKIMEQEINERKA